MSDNGAKHLCLCIADIVIAVSAGGSDLRLRIEEPMEKFVVKDAPPEVSVRAAWDDLATMDQRGDVAFDSGGSWQISRSNGHYMIRCVSPAAGEIPYKIGWFEPDFMRGTVLVHHPYFQNVEALYPLDYPLDELVMSNLLARGRGVELHACGLVDSAGQGHLFVGQSRAGKTTTARLWQNREGIEILSDDRIIVRKCEGRFWMYGTPWHGEARLASPASAPLTRVYFLKHGQENESADLRAPEAVGRLLACSFVPFYDAVAMEFTLEFLDQMAADIPCRELRFVPDATAVEYVLRA